MIKLRVEQLSSGISVVITNHNKRGSLFDAVNSAASQLTAADEIVLFDDDSDDSSTLEAYRSFSGEPRQAVYGKSLFRLGASGAKNRAIALASKEYIVLLDADDVLPQGSLHHIRTTFEDFPEAHIVFGDYFLSVAGHSGTRKVSVSGLADEQGWLDPTSLAKGGWTLLGTSPFKRSVWIDLGGFDANYPVTDDVDFFRRCFLRGFRARYIPGPLYHWKRGFEGNSSRATSRIVAKSWFRNWKFYRRYLPMRLLTLHALQQFLVFLFERKIDFDAPYRWLLRRRSAPPS